MHKIRHRAVGGASAQLIGRQPEFLDLRDRLLGPRVPMITVTGPVGVGKSCLVAPLFEDVSREFVHGGRFLDLGDVDVRHEPERVLAAMLTLEDIGTATPQERMVEYLRDRHFLLALDGCEHLVEVLAPVLARLVTACCQLSVLVANPQRLGVYGEVQVQLEPLSVPDPRQSDDLIALGQIPSVRLFVQRTRVARPGFALTAKNCEAVARLCVRTDGLPLAIELAAARMRLSSPQSLLDELDGDLDSLSGTEADTSSRHRSMCSAIAWSLKGLRCDEQMFLRRLAVFPGHFDLAGVKGVGRIPMVQAQKFLESIVDKNLLQTEECQDGDVRFRMLGLTRQYMLRWLRETGHYEQGRRDHADHLLEVVETTVETGLTGPEQSRWLHCLHDGHANLDTALRFLTDAGDNVGVVRLASALRLYWQGRGTVADGVRWLEPSIGADGLPQHVAAKGEETFGELLLWAGKYGTAEKWLLKAHDRYVELEDVTGILACLRRMGLLAYHRGDLAEADRLLEESMTALGTVNAVGEHAAAMRDLADCRRVSGDFQAAGELAQAALHEFVRLQDERNIAMTGYVLADIALGTGDRDQAERLNRMSLLQMRDLGDLSACATGLEKFAILLTKSHGRMTESWRLAVRALGTASALRASTECMAPLPAQMAVDSAAAQARVRLGDRAVEECWMEGGALCPQTAIAEALAPLERPKVVRTQRYGADNPLTHRELEVAELVAAGMTNREIARRLGIAEWTAVNHLRKIMRKLDCSSRVQVANWMTKMANNGVRETALTE